MPLFTPSPAVKHAAPPANSDKWHILWLRKSAKALREKAGPEESVN
jgi:hypothetical protein